MDQFHGTTILSVRRKAPGDDPLLAHLVEPDFHRRSPIRRRCLDLDAAVVAVQLPVPAALKHIAF